MKIKKTPNTLKRAIFPLLSHKRDSDFIGKHEEWTQKAHIIAEVGALVSDVAVHGLTLGYFLGAKKNPKAAITLITLYHAAVNTIPHPVSRLVKSVIQQQAAQSEAGPF